MAVEVEIVDQYIARMRRTNSVQRIDQRRFTGTGSTEYSYELIRLDRDRNSIEEPDLASAKFVFNIACQPHRVYTCLRPGIKDADVPIGIDPNKECSDLNGIIRPDYLSRNP